MVEEQEVLDQQDVLQEEDPPIRVRNKINVSFDRDGAPIPDKGTNVSFDKDGAPIPSVVKKKDFPLPSSVGSNVPPAGVSNGTTNTNDFQLGNQFPTLPVPKTDEQNNAAVVSFSQKGNYKKGEQTYNLKQDTDINTRLSTGNVTGSDLQILKKKNPDKYTALTKNISADYEEDFLKTPTASGIIADRLNKSTNEANLIASKNYDAIYNNNLDDIITHTAEPVNKYLSDIGIPFEIKPTKDVEESKQQLKFITEANNKNQEQYDKDKIVTKTTAVPGTLAGNGVDNTVEFDVSKMSYDQIEAWREQDPDLYSKLVDAKQKTVEQDKIKSILHSALTPIQTQLGNNLYSQVKNTNIKDLDKDYVRDIGEQQYKILQPENYARFKNAGGYDNTKPENQQAYDSDLDGVNKEIMSLGYSALKGDVATNGTPNEYANIYDNLKYLNYKFSAPLEEETRHMIASRLKIQGVTPSDASDEQKDEAARTLPLENQQVWFNKTKGTSNSELPDTGFLYSAGNSFVNTGTNILKSGSVLSPTSWATLFMGVPTEKENAKEVLRNQMRSNVIGENPGTLPVYNELKAKQENGTITPQELNTLNDLAGYNDVRSSWDRLKDGSANMVGMIGAVTMDAIPTLGGSAMSKSVAEQVGINRGLVYAKNIGKPTVEAVSSEIPLAESPAAQTFAQKIGVPQDTEGIFNLAKNKNEMYVLTHHDNALKATELFPDDDTKKAWYTGMTDVVALSLPNILPTHKLTNVFNAESKGVIAEMVDKISAENLDKSVIDNMMANTAKDIIDKAGTFAIGAEKTAAETALTMSLITLGNNVTQAILKPESIKGNDISNNFVQTFSSTFMDSQLIGLIGGVSSVQKKYGQVGTDAIYDATTNTNNINSVKYTIFQQRDKGLLTEDQANAKVSLLNTAAELRPAVNDLQKQENLSPNQAKRVFINLLNERILKNQILKLKDAGESESLITPKEKRIAELTTLNNKIVGKEVHVNDNYGITDKNDNELADEFTVNGKTSTRAEVDDILSKGQTEADKYDIQYTGTDEKLHKQLQSLGGITNDDNTVTHSPKSQDVINTENSTGLFKTLQDKGTVNEYINPNDVHGSIAEIQNQALTAPQSLKGRIGEKLTLELISRNSVEDINKSIDDWTKVASKEGASQSELNDADRHIKLLEKGLEVKAGKHVDIAEEQENILSPQNTDNGKTEDNAEADDAQTKGQIGNTDNNTASDKMGAVSSEKNIEYDELPQNVKDIVDKHGEDNDKTEFNKKLEEAGYVANHLGDAESFGSESGVTFQKINTDESKTNEVQQPAEDKGTAITEPNKVGEEAEKGKTGEGEPPDGEATVASEGDGGNKVGVSHESLTDLAKRLGLNEPERGEYHTPQWYAERGRQLLEAGADPNEVNNPNNELHDRISIARAHLENLVKDADAIAKEKGIDSDEYLAAHKMVNDYANDVVKKLGSKAGQAMVALQGERDVDTDSFTAVKKATEDGTGKPVSKEQEKKIKELTETNERLKKEAEDLEAKLVEATNKNLGSDKSSKSKESKPKVDYAKQRTDAVKAAREALSKLRSGQSGLGVSVPFARELAAIAPHVAKIVKSLIEEGVHKLGDIIDRLHDEFKDDIKGLRRRDVMDVIAGDYDNKSDKTKNPDTEILSDIKKQANLTKKLQDLQNDLPEEHDSNAKEQSPEVKELLGKIKKVKEDISEVKKKIETTPTTEEKNIKRLEKELSDLQNNIAKQKNPKRESTEREKELQEQIKDERNRMGLEASKMQKPLSEDEQIAADKKELDELQKKFVDKKDNIFTHEEAKDIWDYGKKNYLNKGVSYRDMISRVSNDLGLSWRQVNDAITSPKDKAISDAMWKKQADLMRNRTATKNWIDSQNKTGVGKALQKVSDAFRSTAVFGHGGIFVGTHAGMTFFQPTTWKHTIPAFLNGYKFAYGNRAKYEMRMEELKNSPNYVLAQRAGLKNNPDRINAEEYQKSQHFISYIVGHKIGDKIATAGEHGFNAIKILRQGLFDFHYNKLSDAEKEDPQSAESIARLVNNATGATNLDIPKWINEATFAGGMEASRWGKLTRNPVEATGTALKAIFAPEKASVSDRVFAKVWARRVGEQIGTFTAILAANAALQSTINHKNPTNLSNPNKPDFLKFKFGNATIDPTSGMRGVMMFIYGLGKVPFESQKDLRGDTRLQAAGKSVFGYGRGKLSPLYSTMADFFTQQDYNKNPLPFSRDKPTPGHHKLSWGEYLWQKAPLPVAEAAQVMYQSAIDGGADKITLNNVLTGVVSGAISGTTGFRVGEYNSEEANHSPYTDADSKKPSFKYFLDKGLELPNTSLNSEEVTDEKNKTKKKVSEYPKDVQEKYTNTHKQILDNELSKTISRGYVYVKEYKNTQGENKNEVSLNNNDSDRNKKKTSLDKLTQDELIQILHISQSKATKEAKEKVFKPK